MAIADRRSIRRVGGVLLAALTLCLAAPVQPAAAQGLFEALFGGFQRRAPRAMPPQASSYADPFGMFGDSRRPAGEAERLRPRHGLLRAHLRRPLFPAAAPCRRVAGRAVQVVLPGGQDHGLLRQQDRHRGRAERHALRRSRQRLRLSRQGQRQLLLQRQGRARPRARRDLRRSDACGRATSSRPTTALRPTAATATRPRSSRRSASRRANGRAAWPR